ncbi:MAG: bifunctional diaminohydroxyphosphoribosylaminopyrimidine deaminase/5-amino-6-(5-phosphoribosylamino)uracil reductase RibD [Synergistaceae bacterium]|jgi:diaminohydroxyphosphoribosylaminopyrimidine deaminase/5-amino-6-(5-phosphoribosylamino)uracil reductase|nr:bifunctional diaminohydroxyphosphoribosylaminopyrimidine deaminase/5-amino-6-(5-phosphoribosylamino)uracil reductase RibD [Synergistaceae bacterium]
MTERKKLERYMKMAMSFAMRGTGTVSPNPRVGCVIVDEKDGDRLVSWGYHRRFGGAHAEVEALRRAGEYASGCTAYVNLEPCRHTGKTPPCADALIESGIAKVIVGMRDPNPCVAGGGIEALERAGIEVVTGVLEEECRWLNRGFIRAMTMGRPWVTVKAAIALDGRMALENGDSAWISSSESRKRAHLMRAENDAIMVGVGTVLSDDPRLTVRDVDGSSPVKVIVDRDLSTPEEARVLDEGKCVFFTGPSPDEGKVEALIKKGAKVIKQKEDSGAYIPMDALLSELCALGVNQIMVEGGSKLIGSLIKAGSVDEYSLFIAPKFLGRGIGISDSLSFSHMDDTISMKNLRVRKIGDDIWFEGVPSCSPDL